ncbi:MarR family transcriptional regulator [Bacteroides sp.]|uniref:MarR family winged helix-turn-helix transcriptional regulator n=1 Tax=Bacteroides sp. TaxID=29523 RepID=UPI002FCAC852
MTNSDLTHELILTLLRTRMSFRQALMRIFKRNGIEITFEMFQVMHRLGQGDGVSQQYLAEKTAKDKACMTNLLNNLEKKQWVKRLEDPSDRRNRLICLTKDGNDLIRQTRPLIDGLYEQAGLRMNNKRLQHCIADLMLLNEVLDEI